MGKKRPPSGRTPGRKPSGRQPAKGGGSRRGGKVKKAPPPSKGGGKSKPPSREKTAPAKKSGERPSRESAELREFFKPEGLSLGLKFVLTISGMVFLIMIVFSAVIYAISVNSLQSEMEDNGALMLKSVESIGESYFEYLQVQRDYLGAVFKDDTEKIDTEFEKIKRLINRRYTTYL
ncbi:MAG: hypothetical protein ACYTFG_18595, partial [Planctomycetota bacterium]